MTFIDLRSDTVTKPTDEMIEAIVQAHKADRFGDDVSGEDKVVNELQIKAAKILGKEEALLVTSGTQGNVISLLSQTRRGDEVIVEEMSHTFLFEGGSMASLGGLFPKPVKGIRGYIEPNALRAAISDDDAHYAKTTMAVIENTHNYAGGVIVTPQKMNDFSDVAHEYGLKVHVDGARLFNAAIALNIPAKELVTKADSVQICLSKGLSAPVGSIVAGTHEFIHEAHRWRKKLGGGMRQAGIIAAPGIIALEKMVNRLKEDNENAHYLYEQLADIEGLEIEEPDTNILFIQYSNFQIDAHKMAEELKKRGILVYGEYGARTRFVCHRMISRDDVIKTAHAVDEILKSHRK